MKYLFFLLLFGFTFHYTFSQNIRYLDRNGKVLNDTKNYEYKVSESYTIIVRDLKYGVKDSKGNEIVAPLNQDIIFLGLDYFFVKDFSSENYKIYKKGIAIDAGGRTFNPVNANFGGFKTGFIGNYVCLSGAGEKVSKFYVMDTSGNFLKTVSEPEFHPEFISFPNEKLIYNIKEKSYLDLSSVIGDGKLGVFSEGMASVTVSDFPNKIGYINPKGEWVIPVNEKINATSEFDNGICLVTSKGEDKWINTSGKFVKRPGDVFIKNVTFFQNFRITEDTNGELKITDQNTGKAIDGYFSPDHRMVNQIGYFVNNGYIFAKTNSNEIAMIHSGGRVVHNFTKNYETDIYSLVYSKGDLIYVKSDNGPEVVFDSEGNKIFEMPNDLECMNARDNWVCYTKSFIDSIKDVKIEKTKMDVSSETISKGKSEPVEYVFGIVMRKVRGTINVSVNYACRYFVVTDVSGEGPEAAMEFAQSVNNLNYNSDGYIEYDTYATTSVDKCKEEVNKKYKLSDFRVEYITKE